MAATGDRVAANMRTCPQCSAIYNTRIEFCGLDGAPLQESDVDPMIGVFVDRYKVVQRLGEGGMACVYRAVHQTIHKEVAVKVLFGEMSADAKMAERFRREAQSIAAIGHKNVVSVLDYGTTDAGLTFMIMELVPGEPLSDFIESRGPLAPALAGDITRQVAAGLGAAHALGMVHRDLKPGNIMLMDDEGEPLAKILDFGLVSIGDDPESPAKLTQQGHTMGTPEYMPPEQLRGEQVTAQSDLYALGCVLYEMLSGDAPFRGSMTDVLYKHALEAPPPLPPAAGLDQLCMSLLEKKREDRPADSAAVIAQLDGLGFAPARSVSSAGVGRAPIPDNLVPGSPPSFAPPPGPPSTPDVAANGSTGNKMWIAAGALVLVIAGVAAAIGFGGSSDVGVVKPEQPEATAATVAPAPRHPPSPPEPKQAKPTAAEVIAPTPSDVEAAAASTKVAPARPTADPVHRVEPKRPSPEPKPAETKVPKPPPTPKATGESLDDKLQAALTELQSGQGKVPAATQKDLETRYFMLKRKARRASDRDKPELLQQTEALRAAIRAAGGS